MHLPSTPIAIYCAGPALITHTLIICSTEYCSHSFLLSPYCTHCFPMVSSEFCCKNNIWILSPQLWPNAASPQSQLKCLQPLPFCSCVYECNWSLPFLPEIVHLKKLPVNFSLLKYLLKTTFSLEFVLGKPLVKGLWCGFGALGTWFSGWTWQSKAMVGLMISEVVSALLSLWFYSPF